MRRNNDILFVQEGNRAGLMVAAVTALITKQGQGGIGFA